MSDSLILTLGDLGQLFDGPHATPTRIAEGPYFLNISSLNAGRLDLSQSDHVSREDFGKWTKRVTPEEGDLLFSYETRLGEAALMPAGIEACLGRRMALLRPDRGIINPQFLLYYYLSPSFQRLIEQHTIHGATVNRISLSTMGSWPVSVPPIKDQQAIAEVLGALDDKIAANTKLAETAAQFAQAVFTHAIHESSEEFVLSEITELLSRGITPKYSDEDDAMLILNQKCVRGQRVELGPARRTLLARVREDKVLKPNDVLVNSTGQGTLGRVARWTTGDRATADSHITILRFDEERVDAVTAGIGILRLQETITEMGEGSTGQTELSRVELGKLKVRLPKPERQQELGRHFNDLSQMEHARLAENQTLSAARNALLPQLMSGKLRVKDAEALVAAAV